VSEQSEDPKVASNQTWFSEVWGPLREAQQARTSVVLGAREPADLLHHYTTLSGLQGIATSGALWASDARYLNDASELSYAVQLINSVVTETVAERGGDVLRRMVDGHFGVATAFKFGGQPFVSCFCEAEDLLSQWRGYRAGTTGYSMGMNLKPLAHGQHLPPNTRLRQVVYEENVQRKEVQDVVNVWLQTAESLLGPEPQVLSELFRLPAIMALEEALVEHYLCFKHPKFAEEREWRLIKLVRVQDELTLGLHRRWDEVMREEMAERGVERFESFPIGINAEGVELRFRESAGGLVPYVELPLFDTSGPRRSIFRQVLQGPSTHPELSLESLRTYLTWCGYKIPPTEVKQSRIPLRG